MNDKEKEKIAIELIDIGAIQFGEFKLKLHSNFPNAPLSPIYINLRIIRSYPSIMDTLTDNLIEVIKKNNLKFDLLADIPTAATPIASIMMYKMKIPLISPRIDKKNYGIPEDIDGVYKPEQSVCIVDDVITTADTKFKVIKLLEEKKLKVEAIVVIINRQQGGNLELLNAGYKIYELFKLTDLLKIYLKRRKIPLSLYNKILLYLFQFQTTKKQTSHSTFCTKVK